MTDLQYEYLTHYAYYRLNFNSRSESVLVIMDDPEMIVAEFQNRPDDSELGAGG